MGTVGIVGGIAPESTIQYYRLLVDQYREEVRDGSYPSIVINSIDMTRMLGLIGSGDLSGVTSYLLGEITRLERAGADVCLLASNTPHIVFNELRRATTTPLISIVECAANAARERGLTKVGLLGTRFTMNGQFYRDALANAGIALVIPSEDEQEFIHTVYMTELVRGVYRAENRERVFHITRAMQARDAIDGLILGGTELPLLLGDGGDATLPMIDTTRVHVAEAVKWLVR
ncbi:MAG: amino acid racemase [Vicinamibacterales bacterium]